MPKARRPKAGSKRRARRSCEDAPAPPVVQEPVATYGPPAAPAASELPPELAPHAGELRRMAAFVDLAEGFRLAFAECNFAPLRGAIIEEIRRRCEPEIARLCVIDLSDADDMIFPLDAIARRVLKDDAADGAPKRVLMFVGLEAHVHITDPQPGVLVALNMARDAFPARIPEPMIFWLPDYLLTTLSRVAPDFWAWANATFRFPAAQLLRDAAMELTLFAAPRILDSQVPEVKARIRLLEGLLQEYLPSLGEPPADNVPAALDILSELRAGYLGLGEPRQAMTFGRRALQLARQTHNRVAECWALGNLANVHYSLGDMPSAIRLNEQALGIARETRDTHSGGAALGGLGLVYTALGDLTKAIECYQAALKVLRKIGDRRGEGTIVGNMGTVWTRLGQTRKAIPLYERALRIAREVRDPRGESDTLGNVGIAYKEVGDVRKAISLYEQALKIHRDIGDRSGEAKDSWNLGLAYEELGDLPRAIALMQVRVDHERELGHADAEKHAAYVEGLRKRLG